MKLVKSLLLGSAAGLLAVAGAQAADLPTRKAAPVDYVRVCTLYGPGFFYIPGSDTCIRLSGRARFEYINFQAFNRALDNSSFRASGRLAVDARTQTDLGQLRAFIRMTFTRDSGGYFGSGSGQRGGTRIVFQAPAGGFPNFSGADVTGNRLQTGVFVDSAFVQWGGLTAGRLQSFFDFYADNDTWFGAADSDLVTTALAYTYTFGNGFSATLSVEDPKERQRYPIAGLAPVGAGGINPSVATAPFTNVFPFAFSPFASPNVSAISYTNRESIPDVVGVLRVDQAWGSAQLSGAYHRFSTVGATINNLTPNNTGTGFVTNPLVSTVQGGFGTVTGNGWAVQGGVKVNLPMIAAGDYFYLQAAYSKGVISYVNGGFPGSYSAGAYAGSFESLPAYDAVVGPSGRITLTPAYSGLISYEHYWTPTIRQGLFASAAKISYSGAIRTAAGFAQGAACPTCLGTVTVSTAGGPTPFNPFSIQYDGGTFFGVGSNLIWSPVKDLDIGVEVYYDHEVLQHKQFDPNSGRGKLVKNADDWLGRLRISRDF
ncbi:Porin subfamily protein [Rhizobiales bacterium GAS191]|nr:Porin subfamily protein [Rhizobiales bacterium GAS113]SEE58828.1 Porin subfamily protein [Rhizobiales bacterium GAS191]